MMDNFLNLNQFLLVKVSRCEQVYRQSAVEQHPLLFNFTEKTYRKVGVKYSCLTPEHCLRIGTLAHTAMRYDDGLS